MIYKGFNISKNEFNYWEASRGDLEYYLYAKTRKELLIEINERYVVNNNPQGM